MHLTDAHQSESGSAHLPSRASSLCFRVYDVPSPLTHERQLVFAVTKSPSVSLGKETRDEGNEKRLKKKRHSSHQPIAVFNLLMIVMFARNKIQSEFITLQKEMIFGKYEEELGRTPTSHLM